MNNDFQVLNDAADDEALDNHRNAPRPDPACLYGLVGEVGADGVHGVRRFHLGVEGEDRLSRLAVLGEDGR